MLKLRRSGTNRSSGILARLKFGPNRRDGLFQQAPRFKQIQMMAWSELLHAITLRLVTDQIYLWGARRCHGGYR